MSDRMRLQVIDEFAEDGIYSAEQGREIIWPLDSVNSAFNWFMWFANDPPPVIRVTCNSEKIQKALREGKNEAKAWKKVEPGQEIPFYEEGDELWVLATAYFTLYFMLNPNIEEVPDKLDE